MCLRWSSVCARACPQARTRQGRPAIGQGPHAARSSRIAAAAARQPHLDLCRAVWAPTSPHRPHQWWPPAAMRRRRSGLVAGLGFGEPGADRAPAASAGASPPGVGPARAAFCRLRAAGRAAHAGLRRGLSRGRNGHGRAWQQRAAVVGGGCGPFRPGGQGSRGRVPAALEPGGRADRVPAPHRDARLSPHPRRCPPGAGPGARRLRVRGALP